MSKKNVTLRTLLNKYVKNECRFIIKVKSYQSFIVYMVFTFIVFNFSEWLIKNMTDCMVNGGYKDAGYEYVIIDDCWLEKDRDPVTNELIPDRIRFPNGIKHLADYVNKMNQTIFSLSFQTFSSL